MLSIRDAAELIRAAHGQVHVLVNTVGVITDAGVTTATEDVWRWFIELHLMSLVHVVNAFLAHRGLLGPRGTRRIDREDLGPEFAVFLADVVKRRGIVA